MKLAGPDFSWIRTSAVTNMGASDGMNTNASDQRVREKFPEAFWIESTIMARMRFDLAVIL
jgi:hypothetical protein